MVSGTILGKHFAHGCKKVKLQVQASMDVTGMENSLRQVWNILNEISMQIRGEPEFLSSLVVVLCEHGRNIEDFAEGLERYDA